jgi:enterochelin esterase family protein
LAILLDGQFWAQQMPVWEPLMQLTRAGKLPAAVYLLIDVIDQKHRTQELTCNDEFWQAVQQELLPQLADWAPHSTDARNTIIAGQSFGGLSSLYAGLRWPERFGAVISQSGSFWWPRRDMLQLPALPEDACWLIRQLEQRRVGMHCKLRVFLEAGVQEKLIHQVSDRMAEQLRAAGHRVQYRVIEGGHDALCWRGGLLDGLQALWATPAVFQAAALANSLQA